MTLDDLAADYRALEELMIEDNGPGASLDDHLAIDKALDEIMAEIATNQGEKLDGYVAFIKKIEREAAAKKAWSDQCKAEAATYAEEAKFRENKAQRLKDRLIQYFDATGQKKATTATGFTVTVVNNGGQLPLVIREDVPVPVEFTKTVAVTTVDKEHIREVLESGTPLEFAHLMPRGRRLTVK